MKIDWNRIEAEERKGQAGSHTNRTISIKIYCVRLVTLRIRMQSQPRPSDVIPNLIPSAPNSPASPDSAVAYSELRGVHYNVYPPLLPVNARVRRTVQCSAGEFVSKIAPDAQTAQAPD